jgi:hypothetical protein
MRDVYWDMNPLPGEAANAMSRPSGENVRLST